MVYVYCICIFNLVLISLIFTMFIGCYKARDEANSTWEQTKYTKTFFHHFKSVLDCFKNCSVSQFKWNCIDKDINPLSVIFITITVCDDA